MDVTDIDPGRDFRLEIERAVGTCEVLLAVIGRDWLQTQTASGRRRLDDPEDYVRLEIAAALRRNIPVIPVLVEGAGIPAEADLPEDLRPLAVRQAVELRHAHWDRDEAALIEHLDELAPRRQYRRPLAVALTALLLALVGWAVWNYFFRPMPPTDDLIVLVADFDGPDPKGSGVTDKVIQKLTETTSPYNCTHPRAAADHYGSRRKRGGGGGGQKTRGGRRYLGPVSADGVYGGSQRQLRTSSGTAVHARTRSSRAKPGRELERRRPGLD